jgi:hypothetical protein
MVPLPGYRLRSGIIAERRPRAKNCPGCQLRKCPQTGILGAEQEKGKNMPHEPKEIKSAVTRDASVTANDRKLRADYDRGLPPDKSRINDYNLDLKSNDTSLQRAAMQVNRRRSGPAT